MANVTTGKLTRGLRGLNSSEMFCSTWWFCLNHITALWHIPKKAKVFWLNASTSRLPGAYKMQLARDAATSDHQKAPCCYRLAGDKYWQMLDTLGTGISDAFTQLGVTDEPTTVWVQLLYE